ncbi:hypothetical protein V9T40_011000 [Parthenolecanium corni]|uniref:Uncharacterized protein n=1 Tax=Parthenolecanium corni TaxID=536013 RepID=A0AAN9XY52_9HEMI
MNSKATKYELHESGGLKDTTKVQQVATAVCISAFGLRTPKLCTASAVLYVASFVFRRLSTHISSGSAPSSEYGSKLENASTQS